MKNSCAQSGKCQYCEEYIERQTPVQTWAAIQDSNPRTNEICDSSETRRHVLAWGKSETTKTKTTAAHRPQSAPSIQGRTLLDTLR